MLLVLSLWLPLLKSQYVECRLVFSCQFIPQSFLSKWLIWGCWYFKISNGISTVKENLVPSLCVPIKGVVPQLSLSTKISKYAKSWFPATLSLMDIFWKRKVFFCVWVFFNVLFFYPFLLRIHLSLELIVPLFNVWRPETFSNFSHRSLFHLCFGGFINHNLKCLVLASKPLVGYAFVLFSAMTSWQVPRFDLEGTCFWK